MAIAGRGAPCIIPTLGKNTLRKAMARGVIVSFLGMFVMACSGCGGGGGGSGGSNAAPAQAQQPVPPKPVAVSVFGDSTMAGVEKINGQYVVTKILAADLQGDLQAQLGPTVTVVENAQQGTTLADLINGTSGFQNLTQYIATDPSPVFVENFGLNDAISFTPDQYRANLTTFITTVRNANRIVVLEEPNPACATGTTSGEMTYPSGLTIAAYVKVVDDLAQQYNLPLIRQYEPIKAIPNFCSMYSDGNLHPGSDLYAIKARNEAAVLVPLIKTLQ